MINRQQNNVAITQPKRPHLDFNKINLVEETINDAILEVGVLRKADRNLTDEERILKAIANNDVVYLRQVSEFFFRGSGIYARMISYLANIYRYDWFLVPHLHDREEITSNEKGAKKLKEQYHLAVERLENFHAKKNFTEISQKVLIQGVYYGYVVKGSNNSFYLQELPPNYCRHIWDVGDSPVVEFNVKFFDDNFKDDYTRKSVLKAFPDEIRKCYEDYQKGKKFKTLQIGDQQATTNWCALNPDNTVRFTLNGREYPPFITVVPHLLNLDEAQELDKKRTAQRLLKIIIQKLPLDKNGEMLFDEEEGRDIHNNAKKMLSGAVGTDVLTTFADVEVESLADSSVAASQTDDLERFERQVYNEFGGSQLLFNTEGSAALEKSILNDEATMRGLKDQYEIFFNSLLKDFNKNKLKCHFSVDILNTTIYNYKELAKMYKEQMQVGFSKLLPQIAMGHSQGSILATAYFENDLLDLINVFIPPLMSSTMNADILDRKIGAKDGSGKVPAGDENKSGRPTNESKGEATSEKTIANKESKQ